MVSVSRQSYYAGPLQITEVVIDILGSPSQVRIYNAQMAQPLNEAEKLAQSKLPENLKPYAKMPDSVKQRLTDAQSNAAQATSAPQIQKMFPGKRVVSAHGKMSETQLEEIMIDFLNGDIDILVCTTIIETGLDVANVNTIIIENADKMGLSQLYQLKGRVGRSNRLAYAYLTYEKNKVLDQTAQKRLQAIKEFTEFGSGFRIAMRDLEIRGAGNLLGKQQHGNMNLVGYDMYCSLLESAVAELKGEKAQIAFDVNIDLKLSAYIPKTYIEDENLRMDIYKKIASISDEEDMSLITDELIDRFGTFDKNVENLIDIAYIKSLCQTLRISDVTQKDGFINFTIEDNVNPKVIVDILADKSLKLMFSSGEKSYLSSKCSEDILSNIIYI